MSKDGFPDVPVLPGLHLLGTFGGLTLQPSVAVQPFATLIQWQVLRTPTGSIHLVGYCTERREGRACTAVVSFDPAAKRCTTKSGRTYVLSGPPGRNIDAAWVWEQFAAANAISEAVDVTQEFAAGLARGGHP